MSQLVDGQVMVVAESGSQRAGGALSIAIRVPAHFKMNWDGEVAHSIVVLVWRSAEWIAV